MKTIRFLTTCSLVLTLLVPNMLSVDAKSKPKAKPTTSTVKNDTIYQKAKKELPEDYYVVYRIVERIARADAIDNTSWRVAIGEKYDINAFASDVNLLTVFNGLLDQLSGDPSALACVMGHEMAHHTKRHIAVSQAEQEKLIAQYQAEAEQEAMKEAQSAQNEASSSAIGGAVIQGIGNAVGGIGGLFGKVGGGMLGASAQNRIELARKRIPAIVERKKQELKDKIAENSRKQELEADELGYKYIVTAGFEPEGCMRVMEILGRTPGSEFDTTHPAIPKRIEQLKTLMTQYPPAKLAQQGQQKLATIPPLTYDISKDKASLRINSRRGGSSKNTIERMFDK
ncbi:MAG: M48 family metallopeptidase [Cuspidothrix sp.]